MYQARVTLLMYPFKRGLHGWPSLNIGTSSRFVSLPQMAFTQAWYKQRNFEHTPWQSIIKCHGPHKCEGRNLAIVPALRTQVASWNPYLDCILEAVLAYPLSFACGNNLSTPPPLSLPFCIFLLSNFACLLQGISQRTHSYCLLHDDALMGYWGHDL